ncbi:hypothetical protein SAMN02745945_02800 [Peptoclostridium litorale DSM 5388]|uniref:SbsA Ig-like domain-containing protein n=1 Tax=Peptoclostridium litorale DSM 5388 TaxID=1121324 RepID=A0A069RFI7_PEPLI|nr:hypothetical protein [Peptoclostridium litorale]KDR94960.1 hypothetical protein CLIT_12c00280 [Peptoclostridium litorale DSM 5388]SIO33778.1 hypothetical protein SAMN02745945_02800 [Peptoclostridium litorale DSM 5388]
MSISKNTQFNNLRLHCIFAFSILIFLSSCAFFNAHAAPDESLYEEFYPSYDTVASEYIWNVKFSDSVDLDSAKTGISIYTVDSSGGLQEFPIVPALDSSDPTVIKLNHALAFEGNSSYKLFIDSSVKSLSGDSLTEPVIMNFSTYPESTGDFSASTSSVLKLISNDESNPAYKINSAYPYIEVQFNRQIHADTLSSPGGFLQEPGGITSGGMPHNLYVNGKLTDATVVDFEWADESTAYPKLYMEVRGAANISEGSTVKFSFKPNTIKDASGEYLPTEELSQTAQNFSTPKPSSVLLAESIFPGSIKNDPTNAGNGHIQIYFPSGTDLSPIIAMDKDLIMTKSDGTQYTAQLHMDNAGIIEYGIYHIMDVNINVPFEIGDTFTFSGLDGTNLSSLKLIVTELH